MDPTARLIAAVAALAPVAEILPSRTMGSEIHVPLRTPEGHAAVMSPLRERLDRDDAVALGAHLTRPWPPVLGEAESWIISIHRDRVEMLAVALERRVVYPLLLCGQTIDAIDRMAPTLAAEEATVHIGHHKRLVAQTLRLVPSEYLDGIEEGIRSRKERLSDNPFERAFPDSFGTDAALLDAVHQARACPLERAA